jgi:YidC/Oxa1 family membrane protein insertase
MDRTGWIVVSTCAVLLVLWMQFMVPSAPPVPPKTAEEPAAAGAAPGDTLGKASPPAPARPADPGKTVALETDRAVFTIASRGGGIVSAALKDHARRFGSEERYELNRPDRADSGDAVGALRIGPEGFDEVAYEVTEESGSVVLSGVLEGGLRVTKRFGTVAPRPELKESDPSGHVVTLQLRVENTGKEPLSLAPYSLYGGAAATTHPRGQMDTGVFWRQGGFTFRRVDWFKPFLFRPEREVYERVMRHLDWAGVKSEYFTIITRQLDHHGGRIWARRFPTVVEGHEEESRRMDLHGIECGLGLPDVALEPGETQVFDYEIYLGPKQFSLLKNLQEGQREVMGYDKIPVFGTLFGWLIRPLAGLLVTLLTTFVGWFGNYGIAVMLLTVVVRAAMWPLHAKAHATSKQMAQLTPLLNELKEKYESDPQKLQQEQMKLWGEYGINPMGGCLPALVQMPIFIAYFRMLASAVELRHEPFVAWIKDLSMPDTITNIGGLDLNLLPILMAGTSYLQFAMMPKTGDKNQRMIFMMFPLMFLFFCYTYASALALYWTWSNLISIGQTYVLNKRPVPALKKTGKRKKSWLQNLHEQAEAAQKAKAAGRPFPSPGAASPGMPGASSSSYGERGPRNQKPKSSRKRKRR